MKKKKDKSRVLVTYRCLRCGADYQKYFELYYANPTKGGKPYHSMKKCGYCKIFGEHERILPDDDDTMNYKRPTLFT